VLLLFPDLVPHPVSFHKTVLVFSKNEIAIILFFTAITICSDILESIYYTNNVKCYSYICCLSSFCANDLGVGAYLLEKRGIHEVHGLPMGKTFFSLLCDSQQ
jgi:hypothetical protein